MVNTQNNSLIVDAAKTNDISIMTKFPSDSKVWGPGVWWNIHILAKRAGKELNNKNKINEYIEYINYILPKLPCSTCREHATDYLKQNPLEEFIEVEEGMFRWSWIFHNAVNARLGKQIIDYYTAVNIYEDDGVCFDTCGS